MQTGPPPFSRAKRIQDGATVQASNREGGSPVTSERMKRLRSMSDSDLDAESWTPIGQGTVRDLVAIRIMDCWVHEQDIRRAVAKPGNLTGPFAEHAFGRHAQAMGFVVGKKVGAPDGTTVVFDVDDFG